MESYCAFVTYDTERFSGHPAAQLPTLQRTLHQAVETAFALSGLTSLWASAAREESGDGALVVMSHEALPRLIDTFPAQLQRILHDLDPDLRAQRAQIRIRVAIDAGLVDDVHATSAPKINVSRLVESAALREALARSHPDVTFLALLLSAEVFTHYVAGGRTRLHSAQFTPCHVRVKTFEHTGYLHVPVPSLANTEHCGRAGI
ncbi:hypothetical protein [Actinomadura fibrosa]|uniref:Uncharacterized protein n=1 Tax=Actinomadura fibrosa TaxID=111802 RepID=A0ABW2XE91_9ACTN|nr:hypothetical protein [Actinomadura fibrosa]